MTERCPHGFDERLISGYLDGELTQTTAQRVRIHLEDCTVCRSTHDELARLREVTMTTRTREPEDDQWREAPRSCPARIGRRAGWLIGIPWAVLTAGYGLWQAWIGSEDLLERLLVFGGLAALALLFLSVLIDRIIAARTDTYLEVEK